MAKINPSEKITVVRAGAHAPRVRLADIWAFRDLLLALAMRDIRLRYSQTALGAAWVVIQPLLGALVFTFVFKFIAKIPPGDTPYFIFAYAGMTAWNIFSGTLLRSTDSVIANADLIRKVYFPRVILPAATVPSVAIDFGIALAFLLVMSLATGAHIGFAILIAPVTAIILALIALGLGMIAGSLAVQFRDIKHITPLGIQLLMYGSPVGYAISAVPEKFRKLYMLNPLAGPIEVMRTAATGEPVDFTLLLYPIAFAVATLLIGLAAFRRFERKFADVI